MPSPSSSRSTSSPTSRPPPSPPLPIPHPPSCSAANAPSLPSTPSSPPGSAPSGCRMSRFGGPAYSPLSANGSHHGDRPPTEMVPLSPRCDYNHWLIVMDKPDGDGAIKQQMIDCYAQTLAKVLGSEEESKKKIYDVSCDRYFGFCCEIDGETSNQLEGLPGVLFVLSDSSMDLEYQDYGAELFVTGEIVKDPQKGREGWILFLREQGAGRSTMTELCMFPAERTWTDGLNVCIVRWCYLGCASNCGAIKVFKGHVLILLKLKQTAYGWGPMWVMMSGDIPENCV